MKTHRTLSWIGVALSILLPAAVPALGPEPVVSSVVVIEPTPPWYKPLAVTLRADRTTYLEGDEVRLTIRANEDSHLFVYSTDGDGITRQLLPNAWDRDNFVRARETRRIPSSSYLLRASTPGWDSIHVIAVSAEGDWWTVPGPCLRYSDDDPFPLMPGGVENARFEIQGHLQRSLEAEVARVHAKRKTNREARVKVEPVPVQPRWGEAATRLYVRPRQQPVEGTWVTPYYIIQDDWWTGYDPYREFDRLRYDVRHQVDEVRHEAVCDPPASISRPVDRRIEYRTAPQRDRLYYYHDSVSDRPGSSHRETGRGLEQQRPITGSTQGESGRNSLSDRQGTTGSVRR